MTTRFVIYSRAACHLCDVLHDELTALTAGHDVTINVVDVDSSDDLRREYGAHVPVLTSGGEEICRYRLDAKRVMAWLDG